MVESRLNIDTLCHFSGMGEIRGKLLSKLPKFPDYPNALLFYGSIVASSTSMIGMLSFTA